MTDEREAVVGDSLAPTTVRRVAVAPVAEDPRLVAWYPGC
jgi:hypothetical protein